MKAIYPGTFDPPTLGHFNIIQRAAKLCDHLVVAVGKNSQKSPQLSVEKRVSLLKAITQELKNVSVEAFEGLLCDFAAQKNVSLVIRGVRGAADFEYEAVQGQMNKRLTGIETLYLAVDEEYRLISSTLVKEIAAGGRSIADFVPAAVAKTWNS